MRSVAMWRRSCVCDAMAMWRGARGLRWGSSEVDGSLGLVCARAVLWVPAQAPDGCGAFWAPRPSGAFLRSLEQAGTCARGQPA